MNEETLGDKTQRLLESWAEIATRKKDAVDLLHYVYKQIFDEPIRKNCGDCYVKAYKKIQRFVYLHSETTNNPITMSNLRKDRKYLLKDGNVLTVGFGGETYTNDNLTDKAAVALLKAHPTLIKHFEKYPKDDKGELDLKAKIESDEPKKGAKPTTTEDVLDKGASKESAKMIPHIVTEEDLEENHELAEKGVRVGDEIQIPELDDDSAVEVQEKRLKEDLGEGARRSVFSDNKTEGKQDNPAPVAKPVEKKSADNPSTSTKK